MLTIGQIARRTGLTTRAIRHYEKYGLLKSPGRTPSNYRIFGLRDIERLAFISNCRALGFGIPEISDLLHIMDDPDHTCAQVADCGRRHLQQVDSKLMELINARNKIALVLGQCSNLDTFDCPMLKDLAHVPAAGKVSRQQPREKETVPHGTADEVTRMNNGF